MEGFFLCPFLVVRHVSSCCPAACTRTGLLKSLLLTLSWELQEAWRAPLGTPVPLGMLECGNINPYAITGTPAIDAETGMIYVDSLLLVKGLVTHRVSIRLGSMLLSAKASIAVMLYRQ